MGFQKINESDLFFKGTLIDNTPYTSYQVLNGDTINPKPQVFNIVMRFKIDQLIRGSINSDTIEIMTPVNSAMCGVSYEPGSQVYIFANLHKDNYTTNLCSNNKLSHEVSRRFKCLVKKYLKTNKKKKWSNEKRKKDAYGQMKNGNPVGYWTYYNNDKSKEYEGAYHNGKKHGEWKRYMNKSRSKEFLIENPDLNLSQVLNKENIMSLIEIYEDGILIERKAVFKL